MHYNQYITHREKFTLRIMETGQERFGYFSTEVNVLVLATVYIFNLIDNGTHLAKVHFASVQNNRLVFLPGESTETVYGGS